MLDVLIVEDNKEISGLLSDFLRKSNYTVSVAETGEKAIKLFENYGAKLVILDLMLPEVDGFYVCSKIRESSNAHILIASAKKDKDDKLKGLNLGADDYIEKPYDIDILLAKIKGIFKRRYQSDTVILGDIKINRASRIVYKNEAPLQMTSKEFDLLLYLVENRGQTLSKELLFNKIWGFDSFSEQQTLTVHIKRLREKIENDPKYPRHITTVWGKGYRFEE